MGVLAAERGAECGAREAASVGISGGRQRAHDVGTAWPTWDYPQTLHAVLLGLECTRAQGANTRWAVANAACLRLGFAPCLPGREHQDAGGQRHRGQQVQGAGERDGWVPSPHRYSEIMRRRMKCFTAKRHRSCKGYSPAAGPSHRRLAIKCGLGCLGSFYHLTRCCLSLPWRRSKPTLVKATCADLFHLSRYMRVQWTTSWPPSSVACCPPPPPPPPPPARCPRAAPPPTP